MALFNLDISKLSSNATVQVIISVVVIGGAMLTADWLRGRADKEVINQTNEWVRDIRVEQMFSEDRSKKQGENISEIKDSVKGLESQVSALGEGQKKNTAAINKGISTAKFYIDNQEKYTKEQMKAIIDELIKKNNEIVYNE